MQANTLLPDAAVSEAAHDNNIPISVSFRGKV